MKKILFILLITLGVSQANATHVVGGEVYYRYLGSNLYRLDVNVYFDCFAGNPATILADSLYRLGVFDQFDNYISQVDFSYGNPSYITGLGPGCDLGASNICIMQRTYVDTVSLPNISGGYTIAFERCCRNASIVNIADPSNEGAVFWTRIFDTNLNGTNSNPVFNHPPPQAACLNMPFSWDHSATDIDGDSLVYTLYTPYSYTNAVSIPNPIPPVSPPFTNIIWQVPYSVGYMIPASPAFAIHPQTGMLTCTPTQIGSYAIGILVTEFRNGIQIGETMRDYQLNVIPFSFGVENQEANRPHIYPNPANDILNIDFLPESAVNIEISIINMLGKTVYFYKPEQHLSSVSLIQLGIPSGPYFIRCKIDAIEYYQKLLFQ